MSYAPLADEVNPPFSKATPAAHVTRTGTITYRQPDDEHDNGDLGDLPRFSRQDKGKGKAKAWDVERGPEPVDASAAYPPVSSEEEEERRIQANLARLAARDQAEKRARQSRLFTRPLSIWPDRNGANGDSNGPNGNSMQRGSADGTAASRSRSHTPTSPRPPTGGIVIRDPYSRQPTTPTSPHAPINPFDTPEAQSPRADPNSPDPAFGYAGPAWHGGQAAIVDGSTGRMRRVLPDKWWKALCAWGADLDGGYDDPEDGGQAGRTNPNE